MIVLLLISLTVRAQHISSTDTMTVHSIHATYYNDKFIGRRTSSGEIFRQEKYTAAHKSLKLGTLILVTNPDNGKQVIVKVNDRCPRGGVIDLTKKAAKALGITSHKVTIQVLPERYKSYWMQQDELREMMQSGRFLTGTAPNDKGNEEVGKEKANANNDEALYNLELCTAQSRSEAQRYINKLPLLYRDKAEMIPSKSTHKVKVRLNLSMNLTRIKEIQSDLHGLFPHSKPLKIEPKK